MNEESRQSELRRFFSHRPTKTEWLIMLGLAGVLAVFLALPFIYAHVWTRTHEAMDRAVKVRQTETP